MNKVRTVANRVAVVTVLGSFLAICAVAQQFAIAGGLAHSTNLPRNVTTLSDGARQSSPQASDFSLTLKREPSDSQPAIASCAGIAGETIPCMVFSVTLENESNRVIRIGRRACLEPRVSFERRLPSSSSGWWPASQTDLTVCKASDWKNLRLEPGAATQYTTRLIGPRRIGAEDAAGGYFAFIPGSYTFRASWMFFGCTDSSPSSDCLTPLETGKNPSAIGVPLDSQQPIIVLSNEIVVTAPHIPDIAPNKFSLSVAVRSGDRPKDLPSSDNCDGVRTRIECTVFHAVLANLGTQAVWWITSSCSNSGISPEYRTQTGSWERLSSEDWNCSSNIMIPTPILPGKATERDFTLLTLRPPYNVAPLSSAGEHHLRFVVYPTVCPAAPDGSFCIKNPTTEETPVVSQEITITSP